MSSVTGGFACLMFLALSVGSGHHLVKLLPCGKPSQPVFFIMLSSEDTFFQIVGKELVDIILRL